MRNLIILEAARLPNKQMRLTSLGTFQNISSHYMFLAIKMAFGLKKTDHL